ncbi:hypothetical protein QWY31_14620 [Cytophagales bacterium LB-30]|uniref:Right-handed parallel beta-helix repeat-containing protein n=1 Tax=Shiella aurantiaca TaxID=3058365 RepID=A0ABT8F8H6_9BACT|nr:hypothetical protein [Shiella aurantiaca]MDN4166742.1 hypothetical protein [Shiella aurantiaca]
MKRTVTRISLLAMAFTFWACDTLTTPEEEVVITVNAGSDRTVAMLEEVNLDGSASFDSQGNALTYAWTILAKPSGSTAELSDASLPQARFTPDAEGAFEIELSVSNGLSEEKDVVIITAERRTLSLPALIEADKRLIKISDDPNLPDYRVPQDVFVAANLQIDPGVVIVFDQGTRLSISGTGTLSAVGTQTNPIVFKGSTEETGFWDGLYFQATPSNTNSLSFVSILHTGHEAFSSTHGKAAIALTDNSRLKITQSRIAEGDGFGISTGGNEEVVLSEVSQLSIEQMGLAPMRLLPNQLGGIAANQSFQNNGQNGIEFFTSYGYYEVMDALTLPNLGIPYLLPISLYLENTLTIAEGNQLLMGTNTELVCYRSGALVANGSDSAPIVFQGAVQESGYWKGLIIENNNVLNSLNHCTVAHAGSEPYVGSQRAALFMRSGSRATVQNTHFRDSQGIGVLIEVDVVLSNFNSNQFSNLSQNPIATDPMLVGALNANTHSYTNNGINQIRIDAGAILGNQVWTDPGIPYFVAGEIYNGYLSADNLEIGAGVEIIFAADKGLDIYDQGSLKISGTAENPVLLTGIQNVAGAWKGVFIRSNNLLNTWSHVTIQAGGSSPFDGSDIRANIRMDDTPSRLALSFVHIANSGNYGLHLDSPECIITLDNVSYAGNVVDYFEDL